MVLGHLSKGRQGRTVKRFPPQISTSDRGAGFGRERRRSSRTRVTQAPAAADFPAPVNSQHSPGYEARTTTTAASRNSAIVLHEIGQHRRPRGHTAWHWPPHRGSDAFETRPGTLFEISVQKQKRDDDAYPSPFEPSADKNGSHQGGLSAACAFSAWLSSGNVVYSWSLGPRVDLLSTSVVA